MGRKIAVKPYGQDTLPRIGVMLTTDSTTGWSVRGTKGFKHFYARPVLIAEDGAPRNLGDEQPLCDVEMRGQMDESTPRFYGLSVEVRAQSYPYINLRRAKVIVSTLATIEKRLEELNSRFGYTDTASERVLRFAEAIGSDAFIVRTGEDRGSTYSDNTWLELDAATTRSWINDREREAVEYFAS